MKKCRERSLREDIQELLMDSVAEHDEDYDWHWKTRHWYTERDEPLAERGLDSQVRMFQTIEDQEGLLLLQIFDPDGVLQAALMLPAGNPDELWGSHVSNPTRE